MGAPKILQSDNWGEFKNSLLEQYWSKVNVRQIFGSPYHPQSQGSVEAFNRTIQDFLISAKDALGKKFNLKDAVTIAASSLAAVLAPSPQISEQVSLLEVVPPDQVHPVSIIHIQNSW